MKKRQRKKLHLKEFQQLGFEITAKFKNELSESELSEFIHDFLENSIDKHKLNIGGGFSHQSFTLLISDQQHRKNFVEIKNFVANDLEQNKLLESIHFSKIKDIWYDKSIN